MIYGIKVKEYVLREVSRRVDREEDLFSLTLLFDVYYGSAWSGDTARLRKAFGFSLEKARNGELWKLLKDGNNRQLMDYVLSLLTGCLDEYAAYRAFEENPEFERVTQGDGQEPVTVRKPNPHQAVIAEIGTSLFGFDTSLLDHALLIEPDSAAYTLAELGE